MSFVEFCGDLSRLDQRRGLIVLRRCESTQNLARRIVRDYARDGIAPPESTVVAWQQTAGHGRHGRPWSSPAGFGIYVSLVRPLESNHFLQKLPLRVAVALSETVNRYLGGRCRLKWPNDLLVEGRKLGGILLESFSQHQTVVIGFGLNYGPEPGVLDQPEATSLCREAQMQLSLAEVADQLIGAVDRILAGERENILDRYRALSIHREGETIRCRMREDLVEGEFRGFDEHGLLRLSVAGGERLISAGEVLARPEESEEAGGS